MTPGHELNGPALRALEVLAGSAPAPMPRVRREAIFRAAVERSDARTLRLPLQALAFAAACLLGALVVNGLFHAVRPAPEVIASPAAVYSFDGRTLVLTRGQLTLQPRRAIVIHARDVEIAAQDARVAMDVTDGAVGLHVESGEVSVRAAGEPVRQLRAGETYRRRAEAELQLAPAVAVTAGCAPADEACLARVAAGDGLEAEMALFQLGLLAHERHVPDVALARFREYQRRFPAGVLAPEASVGVMLVLSGLDNDAALAAEARRFLAAFPDDARADRVRKWVH